MYVLGDPGLTNFSWDIDKKENVFIVIYIFEC